MGINVKKTKVMVMNKTEKTEAATYNVRRNALGKYDTFLYLDSWTSENARCKEDIKDIVEMAIAAFWQKK
jgi:hypothetical protein